MTLKRKIEMRLGLNKHLVAFHALPRAGKDTASAALVEIDFKRVGFGDEVYREVSRNFGVTETELRSHEWKTKPQNLLSGRCGNSAKYRALLESMGLDMRAPQTSRLHLRLWATEYRRTTEPWYWVNRADEVLSYLNTPIVINDLRFEETEYVYLKKFAERTGRILTVIQVLRSGTEGSNHRSDIPLSPSCIDFTVTNVEGHPEIMIDTILRHLDLKELYEQIRNAPYTFAGGI